jgi:hypothetical protein
VEWITMIDQLDQAVYQARLTEFANRLALKRPDLDLLRGHPREEYPVLTESLEHLLKERNAQRKRGDGATVKKHISGGNQA